MTLCRGDPLSRVHPLLIAPCACCLQTIYNNDTLPASYISTARNLCKSEVALAGYRLASVLDYVFSFSDVIENMVADKRAALRGAGKVNSHGCNPDYDCKKIDTNL